MVKRVCRMCGGSAGRIVSDCGMLLHRDPCDCVRQQPSLFEHFKQLRLESKRSWADLERALAERVRT